MTRNVWRNLSAVLVLIATGSAIVAAADDGGSPTQLRRFIDRQVGGIQKMMVPAHNNELPQPRLANGLTGALANI